MLSILSTCVLPSLTLAQTNSCPDFYDPKIVLPSEFSSLPPDQRRQYSDFINKGYEFKVRKYRSKVPPHNVLDYYAVSKYPNGTMIERLAKSVEYVTGTEVVFDFLNHHKGNRGSIDFYDKIIFLSPQNLSMVDGLPTPAFLHELHHVMNRHLSLWQRSINLSNAFFLSSETTTTEYRSTIRNYSKAFFLDELSAARLTDQWRQKSTDQKSNLFGSDEAPYKDPATDFKPISKMILSALKEKRFIVEATHVEAFATPTLVRHGQIKKVMPMTTTYLKLYNPNGQLLGLLNLDLPRLVAMKMIDMTLEQQSKKKWSKFEVQREIEAFIEVLENQINL